jgi:hypothetical protein
MSGVKGNIQSVRDLEKRIRSCANPAVGELIAKEAAGVITEKLQASFDSGVTPYGDDRPDGFYGPVALVETGNTRAFMRFGAVGRRIRCVLGSRYSKYLIGRFRILPQGGQKIPFPWAEALAEIAGRVLDGISSGKTRAA